MSETDKPKNLLIIGMVIGTIAGLIVVVLLVVGFFNSSVRDEIQKKVNEHESSSLRDVRSVEQQHLAHYQWLSQKDGVLRIPVDRAAELTLKEWGSRPRGLVTVVDPTALPAAPGAGPATAPATQGATPEAAPATQPAAPATQPTTAPAGGTP